jgi:hypothetical protein
MDAAEVRNVSPEQDWSICMNGTKHEGAVRAAVLEEFAAQKELALSVMYKDGAYFASWMMQKPTIPACVNIAPQIPLT